MPLVLRKLLLIGDDVGQLKRSHWDGLEEKTWHFLQQPLLYRDMLAQRSRMRVVELFRANHDKTLGRDILQIRCSGTPRIYRRLRPEALR